ncbi:probable serine/threonine-protein phosphatase 2A regulatory subunit B'' subunit TON2 [Dendrobium catenatum]|uniref:probable serine/threonine-protein phosphatase 2A regulatory subunit B'' subunit TON2 n=1 Tax=Dendrobium catenatum TaxID=906689 RepID=UPI0010A014A1|nr:probable serine/threonine-protein phosphatase 2A regulatory subunit B'' subunit TON2 [Dendrobium catenatum]
MYGAASDGEGAPDAVPKKIPPASSMPWVRNLRRFIGSGTGLGSEARMELETKRILLDIFKERQQKNAEAGSIPCFYKKKPEEGSISQRVQRLAKYRFLKKQSELLLNADDLDAMWVCLRENCVIDDASGAEKMNYEDFCHIASVCTEQIGSKCRRFFSPSNFMKFEKDESGRIAILPFYLYVMRTFPYALRALLLGRASAPIYARLSLCYRKEAGSIEPAKPVLTLGELGCEVRDVRGCELSDLRARPTAWCDRGCDRAGCVRVHVLGASVVVVQVGLGTGTWYRSVLGTARYWNLVPLSTGTRYRSCSVMFQETEEEVADTEQAENWFSLTSAQRICDMFLALDKDMNGTLSKQELKEYADGTLTEIFIERAFDEHVRRGKMGGGNAREMDFGSFLDFVLALENKDTAEGLTYLFRCLDLHGRGYLTTADIHSLFRDVHQKWMDGGNYELCIEDVRDEIWDMVKPADPLRITLADLLSCKQGGTVASMLIDVRGFWAHDNRENLLQEEEEPEE